MSAELDPRTGGQRPTFSVVMITYNQEEYIAQAIEGVLEQELDEPFEIIIGEDHSTDGTADIVEAFRKLHPDRIRVLSGPANVGMMANLRRTMAAVQGEFVAFCEGDDYWHRPDKLAQQVAIFRARPEVGMVYSDYDRLIRIEGRSWIQLNVVQGFERTPPQGRAFEDLLDWIPVHLSTIACRASLATEYLASGLFDLKLRLGDVPMLLFCAAKSEVAYLPFSTSVYRSTPGSAVNRSARGFLGIVEDHVATVRRYEELFGSAPDRRERRRSILDDRVASAAYAAGDIAAHRRSATGTKAVLRRLLMRVPPLHRFYFARVRARQMQHFAQSSRHLPERD